MAKDGKQDYALGGQFVPCSDLPACPGSFICRPKSTHPRVRSGFRITKRGRNGKLFACHKLRTMYQGTPVLPTHEAPASSVTGVGKALRMTKIDELPQLWNVLKGEMSLVGARPCLPTQTELLERRRQLGVLSALPGITGLAQTRGIDMSDPSAAPKPMPPISRPSRSASISKFC